MEDEVNRVLDLWEGQPLAEAQEIIQKYGYPQEALPDRLIWYDNGPWKRTVIYCNPVLTGFPEQHEVFLEQTIEYTIPANLSSDVSAFASNVYPDWVSGEVSVVCDKEAINFLSLNLLDDVVTRKRGIQDARMYYAKHAYLYSKQNISSPYTASLLFSS